MKSSDNSSDAGAKPPQLPFSLTIIRAISYGKIYLIMGIAISLLFSGITAFSLRGLGAAAVPVIVSGIYPLYLPMFAVIGSLGSLMIFANDKTKGVYEYLIAYGVNTSSIFWSTIVSTIGVVTIVLAVSISGTLVILLAVGASISSSFWQLLFYYSIPLSFTIPMFTVMAGMVWSSLTTRRAGINSPVGVAPVIGIVPVLLVFYASQYFGPNNLKFLAAGVSLLLFGLVGVMIVVANKKLTRERFLSNA